jgi:hypothetical protein
MREGELLEKFPLDPLKTFGADTEGLSVESGCKRIFSYGFEEKGFCIDSGMCSERG